MRLAVLGAGGIGAEVIRAAAEGALPGVEIVAVAGATRNSARAHQAAGLVGAEATTVEGLIKCKPDWVIEAAGAHAVREHALTLLDSGCNLIVMSIGPLLDKTLWFEIEKRRDKGRRIRLPSGGIGGLDAVANLNATGGLRQVSITSTKSPKGLVGAPYLLDNGVNLRQDRKMLVFEGTAREAVAGFPANVNVAAALSLAGLGPDKTTVRLWSDPQIERTRHEIHAVGDAAEVTMRIDSFPNPSNPRTSYLAGLSAIQAIRDAQYS